MPSEHSETKQVPAESTDDSAAAEPSRSPDSVHAAESPIGAAGGERR
ncbi:hypothetical protein ACFWB5_05740 [Corynebacterium xerosis]|nr:hypothetical protein [Corynebacterium xerosis]